MARADVVRGARKDEASSFVYLLEPVLPAAYRLAFGMLQSEADAEDAVQEALISLS